MTDAEKLVVLKQRLADAEAKYHEINLNPQTTQLAWSLQGQHSKSQTPLDPLKLKAYIDELKIQIGRLEGTGGRAVMIGLEW